MPGLPVADLPDRRHLVPEHPLGAEHLVLGHLSGQPSQDRFIGTRAETATGRELPHGLADLPAGHRQQKLMQAMVERDAQYTLSGHVQVDDAYLGGELAGGKAGRGSENKVPFVAAISLSAEGRPLYIKMAPVPGFTRKAIVDWARSDLSPDSVVTSDGLACFAGVTEAGCQHRVIIAGGRKPKDLPEFNWINTVLGNLKTSLGGAYHTFDFAKYGTRYLGAFVYRFNRRFQLETLPLRLLIAVASTGPRPAGWLRQAEESC